MSPERESGSEVVVRIGGWSPGWEWKVWVGPPAACRDGRPASALAPFQGTATPTVNENLNTLDPGSPDARPAALDRSAATTLTRSPGVKGCLGTKAVPAPSGSVVTRPACRPLLEPITATDLTSDGRREEKMTWERGEASGVPGKGITRRAAAAVAGGASIAKQTAISSARLSGPPTALDATPRAKTFAAP